VIDFQQLGGETIVRCFPTSARGSGLDALKGAGFQIEGVQRWGEAFICRIENRPSAVESIPINGNPGYKERCIDTPPAAGYWSYWWAGNNCPWKYSQWGVKNRDFVTGGFEGWSFSLNATADNNPRPRLAAVRPGSGGPCTTPDERGPTSNDPNERLNPDDPSGGGGSGGGGGGSGTAGAGGSETGSEGGNAPAPGASPDTSAMDATSTTLLADGSAGSDGGATADDPSENVAFSGGETAADVDDLLREQSGASPWAPWAAAAVVASLVAGMVVVTLRRRRVRDG
jgi:hypothetical protein